MRALGPERRGDWLSRLNRNSDSAIAAEWEIAALYCLAKQGTTGAAPRHEGVRELEVIYTSRSTGTRVAVEVTTLSDKSYFATNPTEAFKDELLRVTFKHGTRAKQGNGLTMIRDWTAYWLISCRLSLKPSLSRPLVRSYSV